MPMLAIGNAIHQALADFVRKGGTTCLSKDDLIALYMQHWNGEAYASEDHEMSQFHYGRQLLEAYYDCPYPETPGEERGTELRLSWEVPRKGIMATGKIDRLFETGDGSLIVLDYKTGRYHPRSAGSLLMQASFYRSLVADRITRKKPTRIEVVFYFLASQAPVSLEITHDEFLGIWKVVEEMARRIQARTTLLRQGRPLWAAFPLRRGHQCGTCPMRGHCEQVQELPEQEETACLPPEPERDVR